MGVGASILGFMALNIKGIPLCLCFYCCFDGNFIGVSALRQSTSKGMACRCARLSLSLTVAEDRMRLGRANRASSFALRSTFAIFDCIEDRMRLGKLESCI